MTRCMIKLPCLSYFLFLMTILFWNVRGAVSSDCKRNIKELVRSHKIEILIIAEPRISDRKADRVIRSLRFDGHAKVDAVGFSGGIWVLWKNSIGTVQVFEMGGQFLTIIITSPDKIKWGLMAVYASPAEVTRKFLWNYLQEFSDFDGLPWIIIGDFNQILSHEEKQGGNPEPLRRIEEFHRTVVTRKLIDLDAQGCRFTWSNR